MRQHATPRSFRRRATRRGVAGALVVRDHVVEVRLLPSGRSGTQAHADERPVEAREAAGSTPAGSAAGDAQARDTSISLDGPLGPLPAPLCSHPLRGRGVAGTSLASTQVSWVRSPPSALVGDVKKRVTSTVNRQVPG